MEVDKIMTRSVHSCSAGDSLDDAARLLWTKDRGSLPVLGADGRVIGMITDRDICMAAYTKGKRLQEVQVRDAMAVDVAVVQATDSLLTAGKIMKERRVRRLPVLDDQGELVGIISVNDLLRWVDDGGSNNRSHHDAVLLVHTLAVIGSQREELFNPAVPAPELQGPSPLAGEVAPRVVRGVPPWSGESLGPIAIPAAGYRGGPVAMPAS